MLKKQYIIFALSLLIGAPLVSSDKGCGCGVKPPVVSPKPAAPNIPVKPAKPVTTPAKKNGNSEDAPVKTDSPSNSKSEQSKRDSVTKLTSTDQFKSLVLSENSGYVLVEFGAPGWCGPCKALQPVMEKVSAEFKNVTFVEVDVDHHEALASEYEVRSYPTLIFFNNGKEIGRRVGGMVTNQLRKEIKDRFKL